MSDDKQPKVTKKKLSDYQANPHNHNTGTERGSQMLKKSFNRLGAGRSLVADKNGKLIAGNQSLKGALDAGLLNVIEVETTGNEVVVVKRTDLDLESDDTRGVELSYADNRAHEVSFELNPEQMQMDVDRGVDFSMMYTPSELDSLLPDATETESGAGRAEPQDIEEQFVLIVDCSSEQELSALFQELQERGLKCRTLLS